MNIASWLKKYALAGLLAMLVLAAFPVTAASAIGAAEPPPPADGELNAERLERLWRRQQRAHRRLGRLLERADARIEHLQELLDRAAADGKDVAALQAALDTFADAADQAQAPYEEATAIIDAHTGFDESGVVTDRDQAAETVRKLAEQLEAVRGLIGRPSHALQEALKAFREANRPADSPDK